MACLLDTNTWIHYLKFPASAIRMRLERTVPSDIKTCSVVRAELLHGALKYGNPQRRLSIVRDTLSPYHCFTFDDAAAEVYAHVRHDLEAAGMRIGPHDLLIAAICLVNDCTLVTSNLGEFSRVKGLRVEDWSVPPAS